MRHKYLGLRNFFPIKDQIILQFVSVDGVR